MSKLPKHLLGLSKGDLESLCVDCGLCCYASVRMDKGQVLVPELRCQHLSVEKSGKSCCSVYEYRHDVAKSWCLPLAEAIEKSVFPSQCPYVADMKDYVGSAVLSDDAYQMVRPQIQKHLSAQVRPGWASDTQWSNFTNIMKSKPYTGSGRREGSPGNYTYHYDGDFASQLKAKGVTDDQVQMYRDVASDTEPAAWASYMQKFGFSADDAESLRQRIKEEERTGNQEQAKQRWDASEKRALNGQDFARYDSSSVAEGAIPTGVKVEAGLENIGHMLGGLTQKHPELAKLVKLGLVNGIVHKKQPPGSHATASYNPTTKKIEIGNPDHVNVRTLVHELGHAAEEVSADAQVDLTHDDWWGADTPSASMYGQDDPSEAFAEAFTAMLGEDRDAFQRHAPKQADGVERVLSFLNAPISKSAGHKYTKRTGAPGNYQYEYPGDDKPKKTRTKKEDVDLFGDLSLAQVNKWRGDMRKMSKMYRAIDKAAPSWNASDDEKAAFKKKFEAQFEEAREAFRTFTQNLSRWGMEHMLKPGDHELTQKSVKSAFWGIGHESHTMFPTSWTRNAALSTGPDDYHPNAASMQSGGDKGLVRTQRKVKAALDVAERYIAGVAAEKLERNPPTATAQVRGVNFVVHGRGMDSEYSRETVDRTVRQFGRVADKFEELGIEKALEGLTVQVHSQYNKDLPQDLQTGGDLAGTDMVAGFYRPSEDMLSLLPMGQSESQGTLVHEIGHRIYYKLMESNARAAWAEDADANRTRVTPEHVDDFINDFVKPTMFQMSGDNGALEDWTDKDKARAKAAAEASDELQPVYAYLANNLPGYYEGRSTAGAKKHLKELIEGEHGDGWVDREYVSDYAATNAEELFAEAFKHYVQKGPGSVPPMTRKRLRESFRAAGIPFTKSMRAFLDDMLGQSI